MLARRYRLEERLSATADGSVWRAVDETLERQVNVRVLMPEHPYAADVVDAARRAALVDDSRLVRVLDVGESEGVTYIVSEHIQGRVLADLLQRGPLPADAVRRIVGETAQALDRAGARGLHHLRLTPSNIVIVPDGSVKLIGTAIEAAVAGAESNDSTVANRADAIGLVSILYAGLTGRWPGVSDGPLGPAPRSAGRAVPPGELVPGVPNDLDTLSTVTLGPHDDGPRSPGELAEQLSPWGHVAPLTDPRGISLNPARPAVIDPVAGLITPTPKEGVGVTPDDEAFALTQFMPSRAPVSLTKPAADEAQPTDEAEGEPTDAAEAEAEATDGAEAAVDAPAEVADADDVDGEVSDASDDEVASDDDVAQGAAGSEADEATVIVAAGSDPTAESETDDESETDGGTDTGLESEADTGVAVKPERTAADAQPVTPREPAPDVAAIPDALPFPEPVPVAGPVDTPPSLTLPAAVQQAAGSRSAWRSRVTDLERGDQAWPMPSPAASRTTVATPPGTPLDRVSNGSADLANEILGDASGPGMMRMAPAPPPPIGQPTEQPWSGAAGWGGWGGEDPQVERLGPFMPPVPISRPPKDQTRLVIGVVAGLVVLGLVLAVVSFWSFISPMTQGETTLPSSSARPSTAASAGTGASGGASSTPSAPAAVPSGRLLPIATVRAIDPFGDGKENSGQASKVLDGDITTTWRSEGYQSAVYEGTTNNKTGIGLVLDLGQTTTVSSVSLDVKGTGGTVEVRASSSSSGSDVGTAPVLGSAPLTSSHVDLVLSRPTSTRYVVVWFTKLNKVPGEKDFRMVVGEVEAR